MHNYTPESSLLKRQIAKSTNEHGTIDTEKLLKLVDQAYLESINERRMADRSLKLMSNELFESNQDLRRQTEELKASKERLVAISQQISQAARTSGMAEVATNILHNVGNLLNSVNTSTALIIDRFKNTKLNHLVSLAKMLEDNKDNLSNYLTSDPKGKYIPLFFIELSEYWITQKETLEKELVDLELNIEHIKNCIALQQSMAGSSGMLEPAHFSALIDSVLELNKKDINSYDIKIIKDIPNLPLLMLDKIKLYQIFSNIIKNGLQSIIQQNPQEKIFKITLTTDFKNTLKIDLTDNGMGIESDVLDRIFSHGFTTKKDGHGFGLHYCANAVREMNGEISVTSPGIGHGATFSLTIPYIEVDKYGAEHVA